MRKRTIVVWAIITATSQLGCASYLKQKQLERTAKDWSLVIRASQVIPVYPLTEDLQPGDVFLVATPIPRQAKEYTKSGFLPLEQHMTRLTLSFSEFYVDTYGVSKDSKLPRDWQFPRSIKEGVSAVGAPVPASAEREGEGLASGSSSEGSYTDSTSAWNMAPSAGFPTYTFSVKSGSGIQVALPIQGIPVGLGLIKADSASGSVTIADAHTYGLPFDYLHKKIEEWAEDDYNKEFLRLIRRDVVKGERWWSKVNRWFFGGPERTIYVRVINRVYLTGRVVVQLVDTGSLAGRARGGAPQNLTIPDLTEGSTASNYSTMLKNDGKSLSETLTPGGDFKLAWASSRSVVFSETFHRPLVIGYRGFDFPVQEDGELGMPVAIRDQLEYRYPLPKAPEKTKPGSN